MKTELDSKVNFFELMGRCEATMPKWNIVSHCKVCGKYYYEDGFAALPPVGTIDAADGVHDVVMANCPCGNTLSVEVKK